MNIFDVFRKVEGVSADEAKKILAEKSLDEVELIDVRQPQEFARGHLPGARLVPLPELANKSSLIDRSKKTILYWQRGRRSRSAASLLNGQGFENVYSMDGGIEAWNGFVATGGPQQGMNLLEGIASVEDFVRLGMKLEDGTRIFYSEAKSIFSDDTSGKIFEMLVNAENKHRNLLAEAYRHMTGADLGEKDREKAGGTDIMESGESLKDVLSWMKSAGRTMEEVLDLAMQVETNSLDLYLKIEREIDDKNSKEILGQLISEEKQHLTSLGNLLGSRLKD